jgi:hypothetical protein
MASPKKRPTPAVDDISAAQRFICDAIHRHQGTVGVRRILGVLSLAKKFGAAVVDVACAAVLEMGVQKSLGGPTLQGATHGVTPSRSSAREPVAP